MPPAHSPKTSAGTVIDGAVVSSTMTFWVSLAELPDPSVAVQVTTVTPRPKLGGASLVIAGAGSQASAAVA